MLKRALLAGLLTIASVAAFPSRATASTRVNARVDIGVFHDRLSPYGEWMSVNRYGSCWRPRHVARGWRPYTVGHWTYTDYGWTWASDEDWGWATYHYGRWVLDPDYGWIWVPGPTWAPAYVTWRYGGDWIGWAPLAPGMEVGVSVGGPLLSASAYSFVPVCFFLDRHLSGRFVPESRNAVLIGSTRNVTRYDVHGSHIFNRGVDVHQIERASGRRVEPLNEPRPPQGAQRALPRTSTRVAGYARSGGPAQQGIRARGEQVQRSRVTPHQQSQPRQAPPSRVQPRAEQRQVRSQRPQPQPVQHQAQSAPRGGAPAGAARNGRGERGGGGGKDEKRAH